MQQAFLIERKVAEVQGRRRLTQKPYWGALWSWVSVWTLRLLYFTSVFSHGIEVNDMNCLTIKESVKEEFSLTLLALMVMDETKDSKNGMETFHTFFSPPSHPWVVLSPAVPSNVLKIIYIYFSICIILELRFLNMFMCLLMNDASEYNLEHSEPVVCLTFVFCLRLRLTDCQSRIILGSCGIWHWLSIIGCLELDRKHLSQSFWLYHYLCYYYCC